MLLEGKVWTFDGAPPRTAAVRLEGERVVAVGSIADLRARYPGARRIRAEWITPGLHDAHVHPLQWGLALEALDLRGEDDPARVAERVAERAAALPPGRWILGGGYVFDAYPDRRWLDEAAPDHPVFLRSRDLHAAWANRRALQRAGVDRSTPDPQGGRVLRDGSGEPTGYLLERAAGLVAEALPPPGKAQLLAGLRDLAGRGFVAVHAMGEPPEAGGWIRELDAEGALPLRVAWTLPAASPDAWEPVRSPRGLHVFGVKFFADGALTSRTAWMLEPYPEGGCGMPLDDPREADAAVAEVLRRGLVPVWHAIGTRAVHEVLNLIGRLEACGLPARERFRIEHVQHVADDDLPRLAGLVLSVQPQHAEDDRAALDRLSRGQRRAAYRWGAFAALPGVRLLLGSDAPVAEPDAARALRLAQRPPLPGARGLGLDAALAAYVHTPAAVLGWTREAAPWGRVEPGAFAALTLWERGRPVARVWRGGLEALG
ncbi:Amidohydrolase 3 [Oceanithermus profundus DSM 14977]|uniref:Amidohydrolase 3 n=1 Tax=Oceanithermus profundus (strain DSM 14977 / NBRC 100410 / VKM B-2274 / 506) TaxID=670487 RepID=E4U7L6_OCEP5|nr:amidohydrolase [Oceanithermus profundus]ADR36465.1 Amidohydrolase 3 [Oceanithermus profundus DSM 14977]